MLSKIKQTLIVLTIAFYSASSFAAILSSKEAEQADLSLLKNETLVFQSIGMGIALSIAQCQGVELCSLTVDKDEIEKLIEALDKRINSLVLKQEEAEDPVAFDKVLTAYVNTRDDYSTHLEKLKEISSTLDAETGLLDDSLLDSEPDFPVESARDQELLEYINDLELYEEEELEDDESADEWIDSDVIIDDKN